MTNEQKQALLDTANEKLAEIEEIKRNLTAIADQATTRMEALSASVDALLTAAED